MNDGSRDIGDVASHILLVRELDVLTNEKTVGTASALGLWCGLSIGCIRASQVYDTVSAIVPLRSARVVKDRLTNMSWGFGFLEFFDVNVSYTRRLVQVNFVTDRRLVEGRQLPPIYHLQSLEPPTACYWG